MTDLLATNDRPALVFLGEFGAEIFLIPQSSDGAGLFSFGFSLSSCSVELISTTLSQAFLGLFIGGC